MLSKAFTQIEMKFSCALVTSELLDYTVHNISSSSSIMFNFSIYYPPKYVIILPSWHCCCIAIVVVLEVAVVFFFFFILLHSSLSFPFGYHIAIKIKIVNHKAMLNGKVSLTKCECEIQRNSINCPR